MSGGLRFGCLAAFITAAEMPKSKSAIGKKPRRDSWLAAVQRQAAATKERREAREAAEAGNGAGPSGVSVDEADEVECVGTRTREDRDKELRQQAQDVDSD